jgi:nucleoid-associated protein YgaU
MIRRTIPFFCGVCVVFAASSATADMSYEQYEKELASLQQREKSAKEQIAVEQSNIENVKRQISEIDMKIAAMRKEIFEILGITEDEVMKVEAEIAALRKQLEMLSGLSESEVKTRASDIDAQKAQIEGIKKRPVSYLWSIRDKIAGLDQLMEQLRSLAAAAPQVVPLQQAPTAATSYTVRLGPEKHESLYQIAGSDLVYGDPKKWTVIYRTNRQLLDKQFQMYMKRNPKSKYSHPEDLIFPGQILEIPR